LLLDSDDKDSANRTQSSLLVIAEVQPVLVFEDKVMKFFSSFEEITQILPQLLATASNICDKHHFSPKNLSHKAQSEKKKGNAHHCGFPLNIAIY
jgi:hypothetical protein